MVERCPRCFLHKKSSKLNDSTERNGRIFYEVRIAGMGHRLGGTIIHFSKFKNFHNLRSKD